MARRKLNFQTAIEAAQEATARTFVENAALDILGHALQIKVLAQHLRQNEDARKRFECAWEPSEGAGYDPDAVKILQHYGGIQRIIAVEELSENITELIRDALGHGNREHIVEEIADNCVCMEQMTAYYGITEDELDLAVEMKTQRQLMRIEKEEKKQ